MESNDSVSGASGGESQEPQQDNGAQQGSQSDAQLEQVLNRVQELEQQQAETEYIDEDTLRQLVGQQQDDGEYYDEDGEYYDDDDEGELPTYEDAANQLQEWMDQAVEERVSPYIQQQMEERFNDEVADLEERYPDLQKPEVAEATVKEARAIAESRGWPAEVVADPEFVGVVYEAMQARKLADQEIPAGQQRGVTLESGGGATPDVPEEDIAKQIANSGPDNSEWLGKR